MDFAEGRFKFNEVEQLLVPGLGEQAPVEDAQYLHGLICIALKGASRSYHDENMWEKTDRDEDTERAQMAATLFATHELLKEFEAVAASFWVGEWLTERVFPAPNQRH